MEEALLKKPIWSRSIIRISPLPWLGSQWVTFIFIAIALACIGFSVVSPRSLQGLRTGVTDMAAPVLSFISRPVQDAAVYIRNVTGLSELQAENLRLHKENRRLRQWYQAALSLESENKSLRELLNIKLEPNYNYITARILADPGHNFVKSLLISTGSQDGIEQGQAVISGDGLIGRIIETGTDASRVLLVTDINSRVPVLVEGSRQHAILAGDNRVQPVLQHLPPDTRLKEGTRIVTSGHGGVFPKGLPVGRVVHSDSDGGWKVNLFADFSRLIHVRIIDQEGRLNLQQKTVN